MYVESSIYLAFVIHIDLLTKTCFTVHLSCSYGPSNYVDVLEAYTIWDVFLHLPNL